MMATRQTGFAAEYRPEKFEDVWGQTHSVKVLSELIKRGQTGFNLLLHGAVGSGKTSLVRLFEKALNCDQPTASGSPCGTCDWCRTEDREDVGLREYDVSGRGSDCEEFKQWLNRNYQTPTTYKWQVLFFDEAHSLTKAASDSLLKRAEDLPRERVIFCFATTEYELLQPALRSRTLQLEVRPLNAVDAIGLLQDIADRKKIEYEREALALLAGIVGGQPRDLLNTLEEVSLVGQKLTEQYVREYLDIDHKTALLAYFDALANGDFARQTDAIDNWREAPVEKTKWISAFLLALYYNEICGARLIVDPVIHSIQEERAGIVARFQERFGVKDRRALAPYWRGMLDFWNSSVPQDESAALLQLTLFHLHVNDDPSKLLQLDRPPPAITPRHQYAGAAGALASTAEIEWEDDDEFLTTNGVRTILDLVSFLIQEYGVGINAAFEIYPSRIGAETETAARSEIERFLADLEEQAVLANTNGFAYVALLERHEGLPRCLVAAHLPYSSNRETHENWRRRQRSWLDSLHPPGDFVAVRLSDKTASKTKIDWKFHFDEAFNLCMGVADDERGPQILFDRLKVPKRLRRSPGPVAGGLLLRSALLKPEKIEEVTREGLAPLSAVQDEAWGHVRGKWELKEYGERRALRHERKAMIDKIEQTFGRNADEAKAKIAELKKSWPLNPHERPRKSWTTWATAGE